MTYAIIGFGAIGQALARQFAHRGLDVLVATRRPPEALAEAARAIGPTVTPVALGRAVAADTIFLATPFGQHREIGAAAPRWDGKTIIDVTNALGVPVAELGGRPSSAAVADAFPGAHLVKAFNHLPAARLAADPNVSGGRRVIFVASDDADAIGPVSALVEQLGYAPVVLGGLADGGTLVQARGDSWAPLIFQDLVKFPKN